VPLAPPAVREGSDVTEQHIQVEWNLITDPSFTGGVEILSYWLQWDDSTEQMIWYSLAGYDSAYEGSQWTQAGTTPG
jgi:hypothetical protein